MKRTMKITVSLILVITLLSALCGCSILENILGGGVAGKYKLVSAEAMGITMDVEALQQMLGEDALDMYIELKADGTGYMSAMGMDAAMEWGDGKIWPAEEPDEKVPFTVEDGVLTLEIDGSKLVFKK